MTQQAIGKITLIHILRLVVFALVKDISVTGTDKNINFQWRYHLHMIIFKCSVDKTEHGVYFYNQHGLNTAHCLIEPQSYCHSQFSYDQIRYDNVTNTTVFKVNVDKTFVNGNWSCANGDAPKDPRVSVTVEIPESKTLALKEDGFKAGYAALASFIVCLFLMSSIWRCWNVQRQKNRSRTGQHRYTLTLSDNGITLTDEERDNAEQGQQLDLMTSQSDDDNGPSDEQPGQEQPYSEQCFINGIRKRAAECVPKEYVGILIGSFICLSLMVVFVTALVLVTAYVEDINEDWGYYLIFSTVGAIFGGCISLIWSSFHDDFR